jgi:signal peptidase I
LVAVLGASMSTASGGLSAISSVISRNIIQRGIMKAWLKKEAGLEDRQLLLITRVFVAPIIIIAFGLSYTSIAQPGINLILAFEIVFAGAWAPLILGLFWRKANKLAAIVSLVVGSLLKLVLSVIFIFILQPQDSVDVGEQFEIVRVLSLTVIPPMVSTILFIIISLTTQRGASRHDVIDHVPAIKDVIRGEDLSGYLYDQHKPARPHETILEARKEERIPKQIKYIIVIFYASVLIGWLITRTMLGVDIPFYIVSSESMLPNLKVRDMVIIKNIDNPNDDSSFDNLKPGDIIVFKSDDKTAEGKQRTVVHRIIDIENNSTLTNGEESTRVIRTKGDNNSMSYNILDYPISKKDYIGKVVFVIPGAGSLRSFK